jgi:hypothetical protein
MPYFFNLEQMESQWIAYATGLPGCFAAGATGEAAMAAAPAAIAEYAEWCRPAVVLPPAPPFDVAVDEIHRAWLIEPDDEVNAFFAADRAPLTTPDIEVRLRLLELTRRDLLAAVEGLDAEALARPAPEPFWPIGGILNHTARAEQWYLSRLGLEAPGFDPGANVFERLALVRARLVEVLPGLAGDSRVVAVRGELWSPRKMMRRALCHERDHAAHIRQERARFGL